MKAPPRGILASQRIFCKCAHLMRHSVIHLVVLLAFLGGSEMNVLACNTT